MLASPPIMSPDQGPMLDRGNIINQRDGESLYQICLKLRRRLSDVPRFRPWLDEMEEQEVAGSDPVSSLWQCFRSGLPLLTIYNASQPEEGDLAVDMNKPENKIGKEAAFLFLKACMQQMSIPAADTFSITDLYSDNTTGFVKVTKLVNRVLDILELGGKLHSSNESDDSRDGTEIGCGRNESPPKQMTRRQYILRELVETERQYVHHLLNLQSLKKELEEIGALKGDAIHNIFLNLNNLLDFAQRFLIRIEQQNELPEEAQNWGRLFVHYREPFKQYEPFIANQRRCEITCQREWDKMVSNIRSPLMGQMLANPTILNGFLLKPFQRLTKYPLLLKDLQSQLESEELKADISDAIEIIQDVLQQADASIDKETREDALKDLEERVDDWKGLSIESFGELLLFGTFNVLKDGALREQEKEYHIFLFNRILIMCKEQNLNKPKNKIMGHKEKQTLSLRGKPKMHLKGRIYLINVTNVVSSSGPGNYLIQIIWKGDQSTESFMIKFKNDETMRKWNETLETQRADCMKEHKKISSSTPATYFHSIDMSQMENPYQELEDDDYSQTSETLVRPSDGMSYSEFNMSRNASSSSLRSRSATASSGSTLTHNSIGRNQRYMDPGVLPPLNTKLSREMHSPGEYIGGASYFSPIERDPTPPSSSTRSSSQSAHVGYHRSHLSGSIRPEDSYRNTAPAMARNIANSGGNPYLVNGRTQGTRPSLPPGAIQNANQGSGQYRSRSASSPEANPNFQQNRKYVSGENVPNVPPIPAHVAKQMAPPNRTQNGSPNSTTMPIRSVVSPYPGQPSQGLPPGSRPSLTSHTYTYDPSYAGYLDARKPAYGTTPLHMSSLERTLSQPLVNQSHDGEPFMPSQLRAKVQFEDNYVSMIIPSNIQFRSLTDRIDAKLSRFTHHSIASGSVRLRYRDEDGDYIWIDSDEAVHDALLDWRETHVDEVKNGQYAEILLFAHSREAEP